MTYYYVVNEDRAAAEGRTGITSVLGLVDPRDTLKMLRETLCVAQSALAWEYNGIEEGDKPSHVDRLQRLITEIDRQRPLGPDGKHGDLHTASCGCDDR